MATAIASSISCGAAAEDPALKEGMAIYRQGVLADGQPIRASRGPDVEVTGADAACINCHRQSGFGTREGRTVIPPITGRYLLRPASDEAPLPYVETMHLDHDPDYTEQTLARAIRDGINSDGKPLDYLMPRFDLNDAQMGALIAYLKSLDQGRWPGVTDNVLHFATIVTPGADPVKRRGMLDVLRRFFADRDAVQFAPTPRLRTSRKTAWVNSMFMVNRRWQLDVWELQGPAESWEQQLQRRFAKEPVLAVISGAGGGEWRPVQEFCEEARVPCLFPNLDSPPLDADQKFYSLYFSKGVLLEADLIAARIAQAAGGSAAIEVEQIYRTGDSGEAAARRLEQQLRAQGIRVRSRALSKGASREALGKALRGARRAGVLVLWLRPGDLASLGVAPRRSTQVFMSGLMGGLEAAPLPAAWRSRVELAYPFDLPERRRVPVDFALGWFRLRQIPVISEQSQADTYLACTLLAEALHDMAGTFTPDYLVERVQDMLDHRIITGYYPHLALAPGQRFASKGGYLVHLAAPPQVGVVADSDWSIPGTGPGTMKP